MSKFGADPDVIRAKGGQILGQARSFEQNVEKVYTTVNEMVTSDYLSPEAVAMANEIQSFREDLNKMTRIIEKYGQFCLSASNKVINNQENIIDRI